jgi:hypothetical protein
LQQRFTDEFKIGGRSVAGSEQVSSTLVLGASSILGRGLLFSLNVGIGLTKDAPDYFVTASVPIWFNVPLP